MDALTIVSAVLCVAAVTGWAVLSAIRSAVRQEVAALWGETGA
jgi:hypothetical protein